MFNTCQVSLRLSKLLISSSLSQMKVHNHHPKQNSKDLPRKLRLMLKKLKKRQSQQKANK
jgi:hypothetical protein